MAQGYILPLDEGQSIEDSGEEYFTILMRNGFFHDVKNDKLGNMSCKIHDIMHDIARQVAKKEICIVDRLSSSPGNRLLHLNVVESVGIKGFLSRKRVRTLLYDFKCKSEALAVDETLEDFVSLRALRVNCFGIITMLDAMSKLLHLRFLDLSNNNLLTKVPKSFTKLHNLETLILRNCSTSRELPYDIGKLAKLRCLDTTVHMPASISKLSGLQKVSMFVVNLSSPACCLSELESLRDLTKLKGLIIVKILDSEKAADVKHDNSAGGYLVNKYRLHKIGFKFVESGRMDNQEAIMENLLPHPNLNHLGIEGYKGARMPSWSSENELVTSLPNLVVIELCDCDGLKYLPAIGELNHLKELKLVRLSSLEYVEEIQNSSDVGQVGETSESGSIGAVEKCLFFPSLKKLKLYDLPRLKCWWKDKNDGNNNGLHCRPSPCFSHLSTLSVQVCPMLTSIPSFLGVEKLKLRQVSERLKASGASVDDKDDEIRESIAREGSRSFSPCSITTDNVGLLKSVLSTKTMKCVTSLDISDDNKMERLSEEEKVWQSCGSSFLQILKINQCSNLESVIEGGLVHLTALEELHISDCSNLTLTAELPFLPLSHSLCLLNLFNLPKLVNLPEWMRHLTFLRSLCLTNCNALESFPEWMRHLTSLTSLEIKSCSEELKQRCSPTRPVGQDWPHIHHITNIMIVTKLP